MSPSSQSLLVVLLLCASWLNNGVEAFVVVNQQQSLGNTCRLLASSSSEAPPENKKKEDNKAMAFLRNLGKVGGNQDFSNSMGVDEGPAGKTSGSSLGSVKKSKAAYTSCVESGIIDDLTDTFPFTSSGTQWSGITDRIMGGISSGSVTREQNVQGKDVANVLRGTVSTSNGGGFVQMATDLSLDPGTSMYVDASRYDGVEMDVMYKGSNEPEHFNIHLKNGDSERQFSSYRATFTLDTSNTWQTIRVPWSDFVGHGPGCEDITTIDTTTLRRMGLVAIGREMEVYLALGGIRFYSVI